MRQAFQALRVGVEASDRVPDFDTLLERARAEAEARPVLEVVAGASDVAGRPSLPEPFAEVARHGALAAPARLDRRRRALRAGGWAAAAAAAVVATVLLADGGSDADAEFARLVAAYSADAWRSPTSGLLDVPGMDLVRSTPSVGSSIRGPDPVPRPRAPAPDGMDS